MGLLSFPQRGTTLAVDVPMRKDDGTQKLVGAMIDLAIEHGGRVYLAKDAFATPEQLGKMYPRLEEWQEIRRRYDPEGCGAHKGCGSGSASSTADDVRRGRAVTLRSRDANASFAALASRDCHADVVDDPCVS